MSDYNSSLPVRTQNDGDVVVKLSDATLPSQQLAISAAGEASVQVTQPLPAGSNLIGKATISQGGNDASVSASNALKVDGSAVTQPISAAALPLPSGAATSALQTAGNASLASIDSKLASPMPVTGPLTDAELRATPVPVSGSFTPVTQDANVLSFKDASAIAVGATDNHDYTVTAGMTLHLKSVQGSASGKSSMIIQLESAPASNVFNSIYVFFNSTASPNVQVEFENAIAVPAGARVRVIMSNRDIAAQDLYSTILGYES